MKSLRMAVLCHQMAIPQAPYGNTYVYVKRTFFFTKIKKQAAAELGQAQRNLNVAYLAI